jgi:hypothetical protein
MPNPPAGISFRETMSGAFALGVTEPNEGERQGELQGSELSLHAEVLVPSVDAFIADPTHSGRMSGSIELTGWSDQPSGSGGVFNLFKPGNEPSLRLMVYELPFTRAGAPYYLAGQKVIRDDLFDMWRQTTTLFTRLHRGADKSAPVAGAGIIRVSVGGLIGVITSLKGTSSDAQANGEAVARFGRFFMGGLWDSYVAHRAGGDA